MKPLLAGLLLALAACGQGTVLPATEAPVRPVVIAHRGASGDMPEHTLAAYERAIEQGADFIEPDLVMTRDGVLIARHDLYLSTTTDVAERAEFADRRRAQMHDGRERSDWWAEDFTLAEIRTLRARQPFPGRPKDQDGLHPVPSFDDVLDLVVREAGAGRIVGIYPETKAPGHHAAIGLGMAAPLLEALDRAGLASRGIPVFIQSFEPQILDELSDTSGWSLVQLLSGGPDDPPLNRIDHSGVGVNKALLFGPDGTATDFVARARARGLLVHVWTLRDDAVPPLFGSPEAELAALLAQGIDGVFTDFPGNTVSRLTDLQDPPPAY